MKEETIELLHPEAGKKGSRISATKYYAMHAAILAAFDEHDQLSYQEIVQPVSARLEGSFDGSVEWYFNAVKLDMEVCAAMPVKIYDKLIAQQMFPLEI